jgi:hypothetical protein
MLAVRSFSMIKPRHLIIALSLACLASGPAAAHTPQWQNIVEDSMADRTGPESVKCPELYETTQTRCQFDGGRACLMERAIESAKGGDCVRAVWLTEITLCTDPAAQKRIRDAGQDSVCAFLKGR